MPLRVDTVALFSLYLVLTRSFILAGDQKEYRNVPEDRTAKLGSKIEAFLEESPSENEFAVQSATTTISSATDSTPGQFKIVIPEEKNISRQFTPSAHLGEITESRTNLFNNVQHIKFENEVDPSSYQQQPNYQLLYEPVDQQTGHANHQNHHHHHHQYQTHLFEAFPGLTDEKKAEPVHNYVKFQDDPVEVPRVHYVYKDQPVQHQFVHPVVENHEHSVGHLGQQFLQNLEKPAPVQDVAVVFGKPSKFQVDPQKYELASYSSVEPSRQPYFGALSEHQVHRPELQDAITLKKPNDGVMFVQESTFLRTRKFPYTYYQPGVGYHQIEFLNDEHMMYPARKRVSPWRKILHLIGAFLPFGLLLAALTPSVVRVDNVTQPNIVLSKWRVADLPVEHKQTRIVEEQSNSNACEERSICELISAGGGPGSSVLQTLLWNLATRTSTRVARENGLQEVFEAVKRKDCAKLACRV
ncbi:uncharacterized protein LOC143212873 [Lasioglossum baleicum]|uniref:uncharacterized protein LOC143212873 n=1 Tax=Lasioglossum baleicum TaxID=434251 RepID=UPI003FCDA3B8